MLRGRVPVGHPWALGTVKGGGWRCIIDKSNWLYTQKSNCLSDVHGIVWSTPKGKSVPKCRELVDPLIRGQTVLDMNWVDATTGVTQNVFVEEAVVQDLGDRTRCITTSNLLCEFVYPNTIIKRYGEGIVSYETITPIEYDKTLLTWCYQGVSLTETVRGRRGPIDPFQDRILGRLGDMVVDDLQNTFVLL